MSLQLIEDILEKIKRNIGEHESLFLNTRFKDFDQYQYEFGRLQGKLQNLALIQDCLKSREELEEQRD